MHRGYVRDYRKGIEHPLFSRPLIWHFWVYCRLRANHKNTEIDFNGFPLRLERGCFVMSIGSASRDTGLSIQNIRTAIKILESHKMIKKSTSEVTKQATIINVIKFDTYQPLKKEGNKVSNEEPTRSQQGPNKVPTTDNNVKKVDHVKKKNIYAPIPEKFKITEKLLKWAEGKNISIEALKIHVEMCLNHFQDGKTKRPGWERSIMNWATSDLSKINQKYPYNGRNRIIDPKENEIQYPKGHEDAPEI